MHDASLMAQTHQLSTAQRMADRILRDQGHTLQGFLEKHHGQGLGYEAIARELDKATDGGVAISYQTVKRWLADLGITEEVTP